MTNKKILLVMLAITLVFGMTVIGCDGENPIFNNDDENPYVGDWTAGTFKLKQTGDTSAVEVEAKITFTDTTWTLTAESTPETIINGTYTIDTLGGATLVMEGYEVGYCVKPFGGITIVTFSIGKYKDSSGSFTRVKEDPFTNIWSGTLKKGSTNVNATITFTDDLGWTLVIDSTPAETTINGTYTKSIIGATVTLTANTGGATGDIPNFGKCVYNKENNNETLKVSISNGAYKDYSGDFTRPTP